MTPEEVKKFPKYTPSPYLKDLPDFLKDPKNYNKIQKALLNTLAGPHSHSEMLGWAGCKTCQNKIANLRGTMNKLGFTSPRQYYAWKKTMEFIVNRKLN